MVMSTEALALALALDVVLDELEPLGAAKLTEEEANDTPGMPGAKGAGDGKGGEERNTQFFVKK